MNALGVATPDPPIVPMTAMGLPTVDRTIGATVNRDKTANDANGVRISVTAVSVDHLRIVLPRPRHLTPTLAKPHLFRLENAKTNDAPKSRTCRSKTARNWKRLPEKFWVT